MGTRGTIRFIFNGKTITIYNHYDSYPSGLGMSLIRQIRALLKNYDIQWFINKVNSLQIVDDTVIPTQDIIEHLKPYTNLKVSCQNTNDWYCLLHGTQGNLGYILDAGYVELFKYDEEVGDIFIEYVYEINLDDNFFISKNIPLTNIPNNIFSEIV